MRREKKRDKLYIYGTHALKEAALNAPHVIRKAFLSTDANEGNLRKLLSTHGIPVSFMKTREVERMVGRDTAHQGVVGVIDPSDLLVNFNDFLETLTSHLSPDSMLVLLDELTDPHNVGAIIRSAAAFGASGVLIPHYNQAPLTGAVIKASAGMAFRIPLISIGNINYTIDKLKEKGFKVYGLIMGGAKELSREKFDSPALFIVGNEGQGIREKTLERCDVKLRIPMDPRCESLNASISAAVVLYEWSKQHLSSSPSEGEARRGSTPPLTPPRKGGGKTA